MVVVGGAEEARGAALIASAEDGVGSAILREGGGAAYADELAAADEERHACGPAVPFALPRV